MVGKRSAFQSKSGEHLVGIQSILAKYLFGCTGFGYLGSNGFFRHFKSEFAAVKREVGQLIKTN